jgi:membrane protein required for colicin V production
VSDFPLTVADGAVLAVLVLSGLLAFARGFVQEVLSVAAWIGAIIAVIFALPLVRPLAQQVIDQPLVADIAAGGAIFLVALIVLSILTGMIAKRVKSSQLNAVDRSLGFLFGAARGALVVCLAYLAVNWLVPPHDRPTWLREARSLPLVESGALWLKDVVTRYTGTVEEHADPARQHLRKVLETERLARDMMSPEPKSPDLRDSVPEQGYGQRERRELERLIGTERPTDRSGQ